MRSWRGTFGIGLFALAAGRGSAQMLLMIEYDRDIRSIVSDHCFMCHGPDASHRQAGIRFDIPNAAPTAFVAGHPEQSEMIRRVTSADGDRMPPEYSRKPKLTGREVELLRAWITQGAPTQP